MKNDQSSPPALGDRVRDVITGFQGIVGGRSVYLNGCVQLFVVCEQLKDGAQVDSWFDEQRVETIERNVFKAAPSTATVGGPQPTPPRVPR